MYGWVYGCMIRSHTMHIYLEFDFFICIRMMVQAPAAAISWTTYDFMKSLLNKQDIIL